MALQRNSGAAHARDANGIGSEKAYGLCPGNRMRTTCKINELRNRRPKNNYRGPCTGEIYGHCPAKSFSITLVKLPTNNDIAYYMQKEDVEGAVRAPLVEIQLLRDGVVAFSSGSDG